MDIFSFLACRVTFVEVGEATYLLTRLQRK